MDDLISRQAAIDAYGDWYVEEGPEEGFIGTVKQLLEGFPPADVQPVVHGKWIDAEWEHINSGEKRKGRRCSVCGCGYFRYDVSVNTVSDIPNYCPNCGAKMDEEGADNEKEKAD